MRALHNLYHLHCFKCDECGRALEKGDEFGLKDNSLYCKEDFDGIKREKESIPDSTLGMSTFCISFITVNYQCYTQVNRIRAFDSVLFKLEISS